MNSKSFAMLLLAAISVASSICAGSTAQAPEPVDLTVLHQIKSQAFQHSQVMDTLFYLSDVYGPRITDSPNHKAAAEWIMKRLESYGLKNRPKLAFSCIDSSRISRRRSNAGREEE